MRIRKNILFALIFLIIFIGKTNSRVLGDEVKYKIIVNTAENYVAVYEKDNLLLPLKTFACSSIEYEKEDSLLCQVTGNEEWLEYESDMYVKNVTILSGDICISSVPYLEKSNDTLVYEVFNKIGDENSKSNIILNSSDSKWIYENCQSGTEVEIGSFEVMEKIEIPEVIKIPETSEYKNWDPTDDVLNNPWKECGAKIEGARNLYVRKGEKVNVLQGLKGYDTCGNDITDKIILMGSYDNNKIGEYEVSYYLQDALGSSDMVNIKVMVRETKSTAEIGNSEDTEKSNTEKIKILILIGIVTLAATIFLIKR